ncbi:hypothetical protein BTL47_15660 [Bordetella holmesii]|uniref:TadE/TadG family type IV pilus assembly protein n=1 Tax=Bordetella holmesii TaxID=35814 RepID=UPI000C78A747|nr:TadE family protein [Bordetella holmesii]AUL20736.1 hypothetical protein BTL46_15620 [Bordetella holmesii]AUL52067.1 hypothetical protein BTL47_15660 [Bordetella holmesii]
MPHLPALRQRGAAAIEFGITLILLLMLVVAIVGYGAWFWAQQKVTKAAGEGAQALLQTGFRTGSANMAAACAAARQEAAWMAITCAAQSQPCSWTNAAGVAQRCARVSVSYNANTWPLLATMNSLAAAFSSNPWFPSTLNAWAVVQIPQDVTP